jgi:hypothetical protein
MKWFQIVHAITTTLLLVVVTVFAVLLLAGVIEVRRIAEGPPPARVGGAKAKLLVVRGLRPNWEYSIHEGRNILGRADQQPVDIDLQPLEPVERVWSSRQHAVITCVGDGIFIEDLNSANGTYVNRTRVPPGEKRPLQKDDVIQIGEVQFKVLL